MNPLKSLSAIVQLESLVAKNLLSGEDPARCAALVRLLRASPDGRLRSDKVYAAVFPANATPTDPSSVFTRFRQRVGTAAAFIGASFEIRAAGVKKAGATAMWVTFHGDDAAAGQLPLEKSPDHDPKIYTEQFARREIKRIFLSNADLDAPLVAEFLACLQASIASDGDERVHQWKDTIYWHRVDLDDNMQKAAIHRAIDDCSVGLLLFSRNLIASSFVKGEELPRFDPFKVVAQDARARPAVAVRLTTESIERLHDAVGHREFTYLDARSTTNNDRISFEDASKHERNTLCDRIVAKLKEHLLPPASETLPITGRSGRSRGGADRHELPVPINDEKYDAKDYDDKASATRISIRSAAKGDLVRPKFENDAPVAVGAADSADVPALDYITAWALEPNRARWFAVLGELGMGKTFLCRMLANHLRKASDAPRPLYVDLRSSAADAGRGERLTLELILANSLRVDYNSPKAHTPESLIEGVRTRGDIIIFDGLDELSVHLKEEGTIALIGELLRVLPPALEPTIAADRIEETKPKKRSASKSTDKKLGRVVISCRTHYFPNIESQNAQLLQATRGKEDSQSVDSFTLLPFSEAAIKRFLRNALGAEQAERAFELITEVHNLRELAERPFLLRLITGQIGQLEAFRRRGETINAARLYGLFADEWLQRDSGKHEFELAHKRIVMQALAAEMWREQFRVWAWARLERWLNEFMLSVPGWAFRYASKADLLAKDLRTATFIVRVGDDGFRFAHTSLQEYFLSGYLLDAMSSGDIAKWDGLLPSDETIDFMWQRWDLLAEPEQKRTIDHMHDLLAASKPPHSAVAPLIAWQRYVERQPNTLAAVVNLDGAEIADFELFPRDERRLGLPRLSVRNAEAQRLSLLRIDAADANASGARLTQSRIEDCDFNRANLSDADARGSLWRAVNLRGAQFERANFDGALLDRCEVSGVSFPLAGHGASPMVLLNPQSPLTQGEFRRIDVPAHLRAIIATGHSSAVNSVAFSPDGQTLASGSEDNTVKLWDIGTGREKASLAGHKDLVWSVAFSPDGQTLASGARDNTVSLWDVATGRENTSLVGHRSQVISVAFSPDGQTLASGSSDKTVKLWDVVTGRGKASLVGHKSTVWSVAFGPDGQTLASGSDDDTVKLWDVATAREKASLTGHRNWGRSVAFSPDGQTLASGARDNTVKLWDIATCRERTSLAGHSGLVWSVAFSPDGQTLASGSSDKTVKLWDVATGREKASLAGHIQPVTSVAFSPDGQTLASGSRDITVKLWDVASGREKASLAGYKSPVSSVAFSPDGQTLASCAGDGTVKLWGIAAGREKASLAGHKHPVNSAAFSPDGQTLASGSDDNTVKLWDVATGREKASLTGHKDPVSSVAFSPDGQTLASGSGDNTVKLWDLSTAREKASLTGHKDPVSSVAFSPDGQTLASGSLDNTVKLWEVATGIEKARLAGHKNSIRSVAFSPDGQTLASGSGDNTVTLWDLSTGRENTSLAGHKNWVRSVVAFSPDGQTLASGAWDNTVKLWDVATGREKASLAGHKNWVWSMAFSPDGQTLASGSGDNTVKLWDVATSRERRSHISLPRGAWVVLDATADPSDEGGLPVVAASADAPEYLRQHWRNPATGELAWMPWVPPGTALWVKYQ